jgi:hypothetical protein
MLGVNEKVGGFSDIFGTIRRYGAVLRQYQRQIIRRALPIEKLREALSWNKPIRAKACILRLFKNVYRCDIGRYACKRTARSVGSNS